MPQQERLMDKLYCLHQLHSSPELEEHSATSKTSLLQKDWSIVFIFLEHTTQCDSVIGVLAAVKQQWWSYEK